MKIVKIIFLLLLFLSVSCAERTRGYTIINQDYNSNVLTIRFDDQLSDGTDSSCLESAKILHKLCSEGYTVKVVGYCPSTMNPMTVEWTEQLLNAMGEPQPIIHNTTPQD